jgi:ParB family chromosome partitioning protein
MQFPGLHEDQAHKDEEHLLCAQGYLIGVTKVQDTEKGTATTGRLPWRQRVPVDRLVPNPDNPRINANVKDIEDLEMSIRTSGLKQPLLVVPAPELGGESENWYYIEDGERRWLAMQGWNTEIDCIIRPLQRGEKPALRFLSTALITDQQRKSLNPIERAHAYGRLRNEFGMNQVEIGKMVGLSTSTITNYLALLDLSEDTQRRVATGGIKLDDALRIIRRQRKRDRQKQGGGPRGAVWEPDWFTEKHPLARKAEALCNRREHNSRRRIGAGSGFAGACGQCWESEIRRDQDLVNENDSQ